jgi:hypothetical protein
MSLLDLRVGVKTAVKEHETKLKYNRVLHSKFEGH